MAVKVASTETNRELLLREAALMRSLPPSPHLLPLIDYHVTCDHSVLSMPLALGGDTLSLMHERNNAPMTEDHARYLFDQV